MPGETNLPGWRRRHPIRRSDRPAADWRKAQIRQQANQLARVSRRLAIRLAKGIRLGINGKKETIRKQILTTRGFIMRKAFPLRLISVHSASRRLPKILR